MSGETDLSELLASMQPVLAQETFVFLTQVDDKKAAALKPIMRFVENEGATLIASKSAADAEGLSYEFPCKKITLNVHSSLDAVGFLAAITTHLAKLNIGVNPVSGFFHDHLFVPEDRADDVISALKELTQSMSRKD